MADEGRPTDELQPSSKRRAGGSELTRDNYQEEDEDVEGFDPGNWKPVDNQTRDRRKILKVARRGTPATPPPEVAPADDSTAAAPAAANPFAGVSLSAPSANPFSGVSLLAKPQPAAAASTDGKTDSATPAAPPASEGLTLPPAALGGGFGALTAGSSSGFGGLKPFGTGFGGGNGFAGFSGPAFATTTSSEPAVASSLFASFKPAPAGSAFGGSGEKVTLAYTSTLGAPGAASSVASGTVSGDEDGDSKDDDGTTRLEPVFGASLDKAAAPAEPSITGEEGERTVFSGENAKLLEFDVAGKTWRERGQGEFKVNVDGEGSARMLMRSAGNLRLLMNAKLYPQLALQKLPPSGVAFKVVNMAAAPEAPAATPPPQQPSATPAGKAPPEGPSREVVTSGSPAAAGPDASSAATPAASPAPATSPAAGTTPAAAKTTTWAVKFKLSDRAAALIETLEAHKGGGKPEGFPQGGGRMSV